MQLDRWPLSKITLQGVLALMCALCMSHALADQAIYQCGKEITNQPLEPHNCRKLDISSSIQIEGTRVQAPPALQPAPTMPLALQSNAPVNSPSTQAVSANAQQRQAQSRTILEDEWQKLSAQHAEMVRLYKQGQPTLTPGESLHQPQYKQRVHDMKQQLQRLERDMQALQRELKRYAQNLPAAQLKLE